MSMTKQNLWISIRHYDYQEFECNNIKYCLRQVAIPSIYTFSELKSILYTWTNADEKNSNVIKLRQHDNSLIPLSALLQGSTKEKPFIVEVVSIHQFCPVQKRSISPGYIGAFKAKLIDLQKRVVRVEALITDVAAIHVEAVEEEANQLANCISFLNRRLEELAPSNWKSQIESTL